MKQNLLIGGVAFLIMSCNTQDNNTMKTNEIFPKGQKVTENFTGDTWVQMLTVDGENFNAMSYNVTFAAGSRTDWHLKTSPNSSNATIPKTAANAEHPKELNAGNPSHTTN